MTYRTHQWTEEDIRIMEEYLSKFYHIGYPIEIAMSREVVLDCSVAYVNHPRQGCGSIKIVGRDH